MKHLDVATYFIISFSPLFLSASDLHCMESNDLNVQWAGGEHVDLGNRGFVSACQNWPGLAAEYCLINSFSRQDGRLSYSYGQISALGDFYDSPLEAYYENGDNGFKEDNIEKVFACMDKQGRTFKKQKEKPGVDLPGCDWVYLFNSPDFLRLVLGNATHFAWYNMKAYVSAHTLAIRYALNAYQAKSQKQFARADEFMQQALYINAFADHFLTDAFPAGHVRVPRDLLKNWAKKNLKGVFKGIRGDIMAFVLHNIEGKNELGEEFGMLVRNSRGDEWLTYSDGKLHECRSNSHPGIALPTEAVSLSVAEVLFAYAYGEVPEGVYAATWLVPFPIGANMGERYRELSQKMGVKNLLKFFQSSIPDALAIFLSKDDIKSLIIGLPELMFDFRTVIQNDLRSSPKLNRRLPPHYRFAFANIH